MTPGITPPGYRLPDALRLGHVLLQVSNMDRSLAHYEQVLGLAVLQRNGDVAMLGTRTGDTADHLVSEALYLRDPDGRGIEVYADRLRDTWGTRVRRLRVC